MSVLVLSDVHIGDPRLKKENQIAELILAEKYDLIILNGDFIDTWIRGYEKKIKNSPIINALNSLDTRIVWVRGNHDQVDFDQQIIPKAIVRDMHIETINGKKILFMHGHQVYTYKNMAWYQKWALMLNLLLYMLFKVDFQKWWRNQRFYKKSVIKKRDMIANRYGKHVSSIIIGHTHVATHQANIYDGGGVLPFGEYIYISDQVYLLNA